MSWGVVTQDADKQALLESLIDAMEIPPYIDRARPEAEAQLAAGKVAAKALLSSDAIGLPGSIYRVGINDHSNDVHAKPADFAHEFLNVVVYELAQQEQQAGVGSGPSDAESAAVTMDSSVSVNTPEPSAEATDVAPASADGEPSAE